MEAQEHLRSVSHHHQGSILLQRGGKAFRESLGRHLQHTKELQAFLYGMSTISFRKVPSTDGAQPVYQKSAKRIAVALRAVKSKSSIKDPRKDLLADLIQLHKDRPEFTETYLRRLAITNFGAGHETMCSALTSIMAMIGSHAGTAQKIREELRFTTTDPPISHDDALRLRYTQACIKEAQRLHPVIGMSLSRRAPAEGISVHGYYIPPGMTVGSNPVSLHRNSEIFGQDANDYVPERWLGDNVEAARAMDRYNLTWGGGARTCPGRHLAEMVLHKVVPAVVREFDVEVVAMPREDEVEYYFMAMLTGVRARFIPIGDEKGESRG